MVVFWVRTKGSNPGRFNAPVRVAKLGLKAPKDGLLEQVLNGSINLLLAFSGFQRDTYLRGFGFPASANWVVTADGLDITQYRQRPAKIPGKFLHAANPKHGLQHVLDMWPAIRGQHPAAELFIASSHLLRGVTPAEDRHRAGSLYERAEAMAGLGVRFLGARPETRAHLAAAHRRVLSVPDAVPGNVLHRGPGSRRGRRGDPVLPGGSTPG